MRLFAAFLPVSNHWIITAADWYSYALVTPRKRDVSYWADLPPNVPWGTARRRAKHPAYSFSDKRPCYFSPSQKPNWNGAPYSYLFPPRRWFVASAPFIFITHRQKCEWKPEACWLLLGQRFQVNTATDGIERRRKKSNKMAVINISKGNRYEGERSCLLNAVALIAGSCSPANVSGFGS